MRFNFAGIKFTRLGMKSSVQSALQAIKDQRKLVVAVPSSRMVVYAQKDTKYRDYVNQADLVISDSISIVLASKLTKTPVRGRVAGPDFMLEVCRQASIEGFRVYLLGTTDNTLARMTAHLKEKFPGLNICGTQPLPFGDLSDMGTDEIIGKINSARPDILFVGMSAPKQEFWIENNIEKINAYVFAGVGAAFDFFSGAVPRAPRFLRLIGLEWLHRHIVDPKRKVGDVKAKFWDYMYLIFILFLVNHKFCLKMYFFFDVMSYEGVFSAIEKVVGQVVKYDRRFIFVKKFSQKMVPEPRFEYTELDEDTLTNIQYDRSVNCVDKFWNISNGADRCFGCFAEGKLIHISWVFHSGCSADDSGVNLHEGEAYIGPCFTFLAGRKQGAYKNVLIYIFNLLKNEGYKKIYSSVYLNNYPSINGLISANFKISHIQKNFLIFTRKLFSSRS